MKPTFKLLAAAALCAFAATASAKILASGNYIPTFTFSATTLVPLAGTAGDPQTQLQVKAKAQGWHVLTFSADCDVITASGGWMDIDVQINGAAQKPTEGSADAFCSGKVPNAFGGWTRPSITMAVWLNAGINTVQVLARLNGGATQGWLDESAIVVHQ